MSSCLSEAKVGCSALPQRRDTFKPPRSRSCDARPRLPRRSAEAGGRAPRIGDLPSDGCDSIFASRPNGGWVTKSPSRSCAAITNHGAVVDARRQCLERVRDRWIEYCCAFLLKRRSKRHSMVGINASSAIAQIQIVCLAAQRRAIEACSVGVANRQGRCAPRHAERSAE
jgi:hypothetical protein